MSIVCSCDEYGNAQRNKPRYAISVAFLTGLKGASWSSSESDGYPMKKKDSFATKIPKKPYYGHIIHTAVALRMWTYQLIFHPKRLPAPCFPVREFVHAQNNTTP